MGNVRMRAEQINYGASNVKVALDDLDPKDLIALSARMDTIEAWKATVKAEEKTGASVEYTNALALAAVSLSAEIEASQDLHGYDHPWVGGADANKFDISSATMTGYIADFGLTVAKDSDGFITITGTYTGESSIPKFAIIPTLSKLDNAAFYCMDKNTDANNTIIQCRWANNETGGVAIDLQNMVQNQTYNIKFRLMIVTDGSTPTSFSPYSNICPISGRTETSAQTEGKNLTFSVLHNVNINSSATLENNNSYNICLARIIKGMDYIVTTDDASGFVGGFYYDEPTIGSVAYDSTRHVVANKKFTAPITGYVAYRTTASYTTPQCEYGTVATAYVPYSGRNTVTIQLGQTVYGGTLNVTTGVLTVTTAILVKNTADMDNSEDYPGWKESGIRALVGGGINRIITGINTNCGTAYGVNTTGGSGDTVLLPKDYYGGKTQTEWIALAVDIQIPVTLATPTTIQLTPAQLTMLKGYNRLSSDGGDITVKAYTGAPWGGDD